MLKLTPAICFGDAVCAQVLSLVLGVQGTRHVLGIFDVLLLRANHGEEQVAGAGPLHRSGSEARAPGTRDGAPARSADSKQRCMKPMDCEGSAADRSQ